MKLQNWKDPDACSIYYSLVVVKKFLQNGSVQYNLWCPYFSDSGQASKSCDIFQSFSTSPALKVLTMDTFTKSCPIFVSLNSSWVKLMYPNFKSCLLIFWRISHSKMDYILKNDLKKKEKKRSVFPDQIWRNLLLWLADARIQKKFFSCNICVAATRDGGTGEAGGAHPWQSVSPISTI